MSQILDSARGLEGLRRKLQRGASVLNPSDFDALFHCFTEERARFLSQPVSNHIDGLIMASTARQIAAALVGHVDYLDADGVRFLAWDLAEVLGNIEAFFETASGTTFGNLYPDTRNSLN